MQEAKYRDKERKKWRQPVTCDYCQATPQKNRLFKTIPMMCHMFDLIEHCSPKIETAFDGISTAGLEYSLIEATLEAFQTKSLTPIIKEELKLKIQTNRLAAGKAELPKPVFKPPEKYTLSPEEEERKIRRKEKNRIAASKCRNKKKREKKSKETEYEEIARINKELASKVMELTKEKEIMLYKLRIANIQIPSSITGIDNNLCSTSTQMNIPQSLCYTPIEESTSVQMVIPQSSCCTPMEDSTSLQMVLPQSPCYTPMEESTSVAVRPQTSCYTDGPSTSGFMCYNDTFSYAEDQRQLDFCEAYSGNPGHGTDFLTYDELELKDIASVPYFLPVTPAFEEEARVPGEEDFLPEISSPTLYMHQSFNQDKN